MLTSVAFQSRLGPWRFIDSLVARLTGNPRLTEVIFGALYSLRETTGDFLELQL